MGGLLRYVSVCLAAGAFGGLVEACCVTALIRWSGHPLFVGGNPAQWSMVWLAWQALAGAAWGTLLLLPLVRNSALFRGVLLGGTVALVRIFASNGEPPAVCGLSLGAPEPATILLGALAWGLAASSWAALAKEPERRRML